MKCRSDLPFLKYLRVIQSYNFNEYHTEWLLHELHKLDSSICHILIPIPAGTFILTHNLVNSFAKKVNLHKIHV